MAPKKKKEEEPEKPPPDAALPEGFSLGCAVHWVGNSIEIDEDNILKCGAKGRLVNVHDLNSEQQIDFVDFELEDGVKTKVPFKAVSLNPPELNQVDELSTGLRLPIRGYELQQVWDLEDPEEQCRRLSELLRLQEAYTEPEQRQIATDFHFYSLRQTQAAGLSSLQGATFLAIMLQTIESAAALTGTSAAQGPRRGEEAQSECFQGFQRLLLAHSGHDPPRKLGIFSQEEAKLLVDFAVQTLFKHFLLYQYCLSFDRTPEILRCSETVARPPVPMDLNKATLLVPEAPRRRSKERSSSKDGSGAEPPKELTEEEEIERVVMERLLQTQAELEAKLSQREELYQRKMQERAAAGAAKPKGKK